MGTGAEYLGEIERRERKFHRQLARIFELAEPTERLLGTTVDVYPDRGRVVVTEIARRAISATKSTSDHGGDFCCEECAAAAKRHRI